MARKSSTMEPPASTTVPATAMLRTRRSRRQTNHQRNRKELPHTHSLRSPPTKSFANRSDNKP